MSEANPSAAVPEIQQYQQVWAESICQVLEQIGGAPFTFEFVPDAELEEQFQALAEAGEWMRFTAANKLTGEQAFLVSGADTVRLAQLLMGEPPDDKVAITDDHRDALGEIVRQFAGATASSLKAKLGGEVDLQFSGNGRPEWAPAKRAGFRITGAQPPPFLLCFQINPELASSLQPAQGATQEAAQKLQKPVQPSRADEPPPLSHQEAVAEVAAVVSGDIDADLLMDIELKATLRFGECQLLLRDVLQQGPGTVVELDRQIQQPAELVVGGKVMARGEMVIVDGNYGLRLTEIVSQQQRIESLGE